MSTIITGDLGYIGSLIAKSVDGYVGIDIRRGKQDDLTLDETEWRDKFDSSVTGVIHLAAQMSDYDALDDAVATTNLFRTINQTPSIELVIVASSVMADPSGYGYRPESPSRGPQSSYGAIKIFAEHLTRIWAEKSPNRKGLAIRFGAVPHYTLTSEEWASIFNNWPEWIVVPDAEVVRALDFIGPGFRLLEWTRERWRVQNEL